MSEINIIEIITLFNSSKISELNLENQDFKLSIRKESEVGTIGNSQKLESEEFAVDVVNEKDNKFIKVKSPQVGSIISLNYIINKNNRFQKIKVNKGDVLCIIEAMKVMNEVVAPIDGVIQTIMVEENQIVEYGQVLFEIKEN